MQIPKRSEVKKQLIGRGSPARQGGGPPLPTSATPGWLSQLLKSKIVDSINFNIFTIAQVLDFMACHARRGAAYSPTVILCGGRLLTCRRHVRTFLAHYSSTNQQITVAMHPRCIRRPAWCIRQSEINREGAARAVILSTTSGAARGQLSPSKLSRSAMMSWKRPRHHRGKLFA